MNRVEMVVFLTISTILLICVSNIEAFFGDAYPDQNQSFSADDVDMCGQEIDASQDSLGSGSRECSDETGAICSANELHTYAYPVYMRSCPPV